MENFIKKIYIHEVRDLKNIEINIDDKELKHLILTGKNGVGKTTLLKRIQKNLEVIQDRKLDELNFEWRKFYKQSKENIEKIKNKNIRTNEEERSLIKNKENYEAFKQFIKRYEDGMKLEFKNGSLIEQKYADGKFILAYFKATRNVKIDIPTNVPKVVLKETYDMKDNIGNIFLNYLVYLKTQQSFARNENEMEEVNKIQAWFDKFEGALQQLFEDESIHLKFDYKNLNFKINQDGKEPYGFDVLSDGYSAILDIVINIILRMEKQNMGVYDIEGIVIIDELENHLHIGLQKSILPFLTEFFPKIQFIISTHSPFVLNSIENAVIFDLEKKQRVEDLSGLAYEGIVEGYFDINQYSEVIKEKLEKYRKFAEIINKTDDEEEEMFELRRYLKGISLELSPEVVLDFNNIELARKNSRRSISLDGGK